jgi:transketolase C-terminal domain/subunit
VQALEQAKSGLEPPQLRGTSSVRAAVRTVFGEALADVFAALDPAARAKNLVIDSDLAGSCGLSVVAKRCPDVFLIGGIAERGNFSAAAGYHPATPASVRMSAAKAGGRSRSLSRASTPRAC